METTPLPLPPEHTLSAVVQEDLAPSPENGASLTPTPTCLCPVAHQQLSSDKAATHSTQCSVREFHAHIESMSQQAQGATLP